MEYESLISPDRLMYMNLNIRGICSVKEGDICEVGVYKGGSISRLAQIFPKKRIMGIDTFEGLPEVSDNDKVLNLGEFTGHKKGDFSDVDYEELKASMGIFRKNITLIKGFFPSDDIIEQIKDMTFCFVHVDVDLYQSVKDCCEYFYPKLPPKGVMLFDDYGFDSTPGAKKAVDEYFSKIPHCIKKALPTKQFFVYKQSVRKK